MSTISSQWSQDSLQKLGRKNTSGKKYSKKNTKNTKNTDGYIYTSWLKRIVHLSNRKKSRPLRDSQPDLTVRLTPPARAVPRYRGRCEQTCKAWSMILQIFWACVSDRLPPNTVKSWLKTNTVRPLISPLPVTFRQQQKPTTKHDNKPNRQSKKKKKQTSKTQQKRRRLRRRTVDILGTETLGCTEDHASTSVGICVPMSEGLR